MDTFELKFWEMLDTLLQGSELIIDRPKGSCHPTYPVLVYPFDYGYLNNTTGGDGAGIDVWHGSLTSKQLSFIICTVDLIKRDSEIKLLIGCTREDAQCILEFHNNSKVMSGILISRPEL